MDTTMLVSIFAILGVGIGAGIVIAFVWCACLAFFDWLAPKRKKR
jgi:hypothetical protein